MKSTFHTTCYCLLLLLFAAPLAAQITPVRIDVRLFQPSVYPEDLTLPGAAAISVTLTDMDRASLPGYLRLTLSNNSGQEISTPLVAETRVDLMPFNTVTFTGPSLERFVRLLGANAGAMGGINGTVLAEGEVELCAEFYDLDFPTAGPISNPDLNCAFGFAELHEPPTPLLPVGEEVAIDALQDAVNFTWAPNYFAGPVINYLTIWDVPREWASVTPDIIMTSLEPIRQPLRINELNSLNKTWTAADADLIPGHRYLYQIQATDPTGRARFRNNGYSRPEFFEYVSPTTSADRLCYEPDQLTIEGSNNNYPLRWTGYDLDSVSHTVSVVTLPERRFVLLSELLTTPTFPTRQLIDGGPTARFSYDIASDLDTTDGRAYLVTLCTVCPLTGEELCRDFVFGNPRDRVPDDESDPTDSTLVCGLYPPPALSISELTVNSATMSWELPADFAGSFVLSWSPAGTTNEGLPNAAPDPFAQSTQAQDNETQAGSINLEEGARSYQLSQLMSNTTYNVTLCTLCPDGTQTCTESTVDLSNIDNDCLTILDFTRPDSTETTLDLAWTFDPATIASNDSFTLAWQISDRSLSETTATVAYTDGSYTIEGRIPGQTYTLRVCAECTADQRICEELSPFGGCVAAYLPELVDVRGRYALLGWSGDDRQLETQLRYGMQNLGYWVNAQPVNPQRFNPANYDQPEDQLVQTDPLYAMIYLAQVRTACADTLWSDWSEPILFSAACALAPTDSLYANEVTDSSALITSQVMPQAQLYVFSYRPAGTQEWTLSTELTSPSLPLIGLQSDTEYEVKMRYRCQADVWSNFGEVMTFRTLPYCGGPENIAFSDITATSLTVSWATGPNAATTNFRYRLAGTDGPWQTASFAGSPAVLGDLAPGSAYELEAVSECAVNSSYVTDRYTFNLSCAPPSLLVSDVTIDAARLNIFDLSPAALRNSFSYRVVGVTDWILVDSAYLTGLDDLTEYEARAQTSCTSGENSDWSDPVRFRTPVDCRVPDELGVTSLTTTSAGLRWATTGSNERWEVRLLKDGAADREMSQVSDAIQIGLQDNGGVFDPNGEGGFGSNTTPPDPYADWQLLTSDAPDILLEQLDAYTDYRIVVRTYCPTNGWTDYSDKLLFRTLCVAQPADELFAEQILEDRARLRLRPNTRCALEHELVVEHPETTYSDATTTQPPSHTFTGLEANTVYRFKARTKADYLTFTPAAAGYTTMADMGAGAGARVVGAAGWTDFSAWQTFRTDECAMPLDFVETQIDQSTMEISWLPSNGINAYEVRYKLADDLGSDWAYLNVSEPFIRLENLLRNTRYDYQVTEVCQNGETTRPAPPGDFGVERVSRNNGFYACGVESDVDLSNEVPLGSLAQGDTITAFDFPVVITSVSGSGGNFSGEGEIRVPYFNKAKATFTFDGIFVNEEYQMKGGKLTAIGAGVEVLPPWADELLAEVMGALQMLDGYFEDEQLELLDSLVSCCSATLPAELRQRIFDLQNCYAAQAEQNEPNYSLCADMLDALMADIQAFLDAIYGGTFQVAFNQAPNQVYGFDGYNNGDGGRRRNWYETDTLAKEPYVIAFKSIKAGDSDQVRAKIPGSSGSANTYQDSVGYELPTGTIPSYSYPSTSATTATVTVTDASGTDDNFFLAATQIDPTIDTVPPFIAGLLDVIAYEELTPTLRIIETTPGALDGLDRDAVEQRIRDIYAQAIVKPSVEYVRFADAGAYIPEGYEAPLQAVPSGWLTPYTQQMKAFKRNYLDQATPADDEYIFFVFGKDASGEDSFEATNRLGFMPPGRRFSFIYRNDQKNTNVTDFGRTIAHELGHGAYVLRHPWTENDDRYVAQGNSRNLMDENGGTELWKWQWDLIHDPEGAPLLPGDEDGESVVLQGLQELKKFVIDGALTFMSPAGAPITLPANLKSITFNTGDALEQWNCFKVLPFASVRGFTLADGTKYIADLRCDNGGYFGGYYPVQATPGGTYYEDLKSHILPQGKIIIFLPNPSEERGKYIEWIFNRAPWLGYEGIPEKGYTSGGEIANYNLVEQEYIPYSQLPIKENFTPNSVLSESVYLEDVISLKGIELIHIALQSPYSSMFSMMYAYAHAHQTTKYPELLSNCGLGDISQLNYQELNGKIKRFFRTETTSYTDQQQNQTNILLTKYEISLWSELGGSLHKLFHDYREGFIQGGYARIMQYNEEQENTGDLLLRIIKPELPEFYACLFKELPSNVRTKMIKILANKPNLFEYRVLSNTIGRNDNSVFFNNNPDEETIFNYLLETTPEKDFKDVVKIFMDDPSLYYKAYNSLNEPFPINGSLDVWGVKSFVGALYIMCASYYDAGIRPLQSETVALYTDGTQNPLRTNVEIDNFASIMSFNENIKIRNPNKYYIHSYNDDVDVCEGTSLWTPTGTFIRHSDNKDGPPMWVQSTPCPGLHSELLKDSGSPFDPMIIRIDRDIKFSNGTLDQVEFKAIDRHTYVVPLFYGKYLMETLTDASQDQQTRVMLNALTIMLNAEAWAETKGLQLIFAVVESLYSAVDILYVSELDYEYELTGYHPHAEWIRQAWSEFGYLSLGATTIAFTDLLTGSARIELGNIITLHQRLKVAAPDKLPLYYSNIRGTIAKLKEFKNTLQPSSLAYAKTSGIISRLEAQLAQISIIDVRGSSLNVFSISEFDLSISFRSSFGNEPIKIGDGIMDGGIYKIAPLRSMLTGDMSGLEILETLNGVFYKNIDDVWSYGNVQVLGRRTGNAMNEFDNIKIKGVSAVSDPLASEFPAVFRKFQDKRWDFSVHFSELESIFPKNGSSQAAWLRYADEFDDGADGIANFKQRILSLSNENAAFVNLMKETGTADIAFKLLDDINNPGIRDAVQIFFLQLSNNLIELEYTLQAINSLIKSDLPHLNSYGSFLARLEEPGFMSAFLNSGDNVLIYSILHRHGYGNMLPTDANTYSVIASSFSYNGQSGLQAFLNFTNTIGDGTGNFSATQLLNTTLDNARELINNGFTPPHNVKLIHIEPNKIGITANGNILIGEFEIGQFTPFSPVQGGPAIPNTNIEGYQIVNNSGTLRFSN